MEVNSPAHFDGLRVGDELLKVNDQPVINLPTKAIVNLLNQFGNYAKLCVKTNPYIFLRDD